MISIEWQKTGRSERNAGAWSDRTVRNGGDLHDRGDRNAADRGKAQQILRSAPGVSHARDDLCPDGQRAAVQPDAARSVRAGDREPASVRSGRKHLLDR